MANNENRHQQNQHKTRSTALRLRRPPQATIDQVHISRDGEYAIIEHAEYCLWNNTIAPGTYAAKHERR
jgi:hypothetical protein